MLAFSLLIINPFMLDFFGLARGYGLSLGCQMASVYYACLFFRHNHSSRNLLLALGWAGISVLANFAVLNYFLSLAGIMGLHVLFSKKENRVKNSMYGLFVCTILALIVWEPLRKLKINGNLWYGGHKGFYDDTLVSLTKYTAYSQEATPLINLSLNLFILFFLVAVLFSLKADTNLSGFKNILLSILSLCILSVIAQHHLIGNLYIIDRSALFLYPLIVLTFSASCSYASKKWLSGFLSIPVLIAFVFNFYVNSNLYKTATWFFDAHTEEILDKINAEGKILNTRLKVDYSWLIDSGAWYYLNKKNYRFVERVDGQTNELSLPFDYYIFVNKPVDKTGYEPSHQTITRLAKDTVLVYKNEEIYLFRNVR